MTAQPLAGLRVIDFCWMIAGPLTTRLLADLGAEVIKVESLARVDRIREVGVQPPTPNAETNGVFNDCNVNKKSITLNLGTAKGIEIAKALIARADIVTSNFTPDRMDRWGLGYDVLRALNPGIIVASLPVMGSVGPRAGWRAVGNGVIALAGLNGLTGFPEREPVGLGTLHSDFTTPYVGALAILAAIRQRTLTGEGQFIEIAQYEASVHLLDTEVLDYTINGVVTPRRGNRSPHAVPHGVFPCAGTDMWVALAARGDDEWLALCGVLGLTELAARADLATLAGRQAAVDAIEAAVSAATAVRDRWEVAAALQAAGVPAAPVEDVGDLVGSDPMADGFFEQIQHPAGVPMLLQHEPITWNGERLPIARAPFMGEHTAEIMESLLGIGIEEVAVLVAEGVLE